MLGYFDTFNSVLPLFDKQTFYDLYTLQYAQQPIGGTAWYACLNIVLCMGSMIWFESTQGKDLHMTAEIDGFTKSRCWKYLQNACSCLTDLMFGDCNMMAVQAIIGMVREPTLNLSWRSLISKKGVCPADNTRSANVLRLDCCCRPASPRYRTTSKTGSFWTS